MSQPLAYIHPNAKIGSNVVIDPFVTIQDDVVIGKNT
jgi:UDP-N-acetylglucosamine acyltransferase